MEEIINDMDLALEGVPVSEDNINVKRGLAILQYIMPAFKYSSNDLSINDKVSEIKEYYILNGYTDTFEIIQAISSINIGRVK